MKELLLIFLIKLMGKQMKTPEIMNILLDRKIVTTEMAAMVIYSLNKRAKNWRDHNPEGYLEAKKIRNWNLLGIEKGRKNFEKYKVLEYYKKKDFILLKLFKPSFIHSINNVDHLYYEVHKSGFHMPLHVYELYGKVLHDNLPVKIVDDFITTGEDIHSLVSVQFCNRFIDTINDNGLLMIDGEIHYYNR